MKSLYLLLNRIKQYFLKNKLVFVLFLIGGIINSIMLTYCYGNLLSFVLNRDSQDSKFRHYWFQYEAECISADEFTEFFESPLLEYAFVRVKIPTDQISTEATGKQSVIMPYSSQMPFEVYDGTMNFTKDNQILIPAGATDYSVGEEITLFGEIFEIIGIVNSPNINPNFVVPVAKFLNMNLHQKVGTVDLYTAERQDFYNSNDAMEKLIISKFDSIVSTDFPSSTLRSIVLSTVQALSDIMVTYLIAAVAYIFLLYYLIDSVMSETIVSLVVGATKSAMVVSIFWETTILSLAANVLGLISHMVLYEAFFQKLNIHEWVTYNLSDYFTILLLMLFVGLLIAFAVVSKYIRISPIAARQRCR